MTVKTMEVAWDPLAKVWYVARSDIDGLTAEAATYDDLIEQVKAAVPSFVMLSRADDEDQVINLRFWADEVDSKSRFVL